VLGKCLYLNSTLARRGDARLRNLYYEAAMALQPFRFIQ
jgi:transposase